MYRMGRWALFAHLGKRFRIMIPIKVGIRVIKRILLKVSQKGRLISVCFPKKVVSPRLTINGTLNEISRLLKAVRLMESASLPFKI